MTNRFLRSVGDLIEHDLASAISGPVENPKPAVPLDAFKHNTAMIAVSRPMLLDFGLVDPTPQEAADRAAGRARSRAWHADRIQRWAEWFAAIQDAAGPVGAAMLDLHVPDYLDLCEGCTTDDEISVSWPCATVEAAAAAAGIPEPEAGRF